MPRPASYAVGDTPYFRELLTEIDVLLAEPMGCDRPDEIDVVNRVDELVCVLMFVADPQSYCPGNLMRRQLAPGLEQRYNLRHKRVVPRYKVDRTPN